MAVRNGCAVGLLASSAAPSYSALLHEANAETVAALVEETRRNWIRHYRDLIEAIARPTALFWFSVRSFDYPPDYAGVQKFFGAFPQFVTAS